MHFKVLLNTYFRTRNIIFLKWQHKALQHRSIRYIKQESRSTAFLRGSFSHTKVIIAIETLLF